MNTGDIISQQASMPWGAYLILLFVGVLLIGMYALASYYQSHPRQEDK